jgi:hypothetical protein
MLHLLIVKTMALIAFHCYCGLICLSGMPLSQVNIGADHRVLDGATVARFCNEWKQLIENPELLMLLMR